MSKPCPHRARRDGRRSSGRRWSSPARPWRSSAGPTSSSLFSATRRRIAPCWSGIRAEARATDLSTPMSRSRWTKSRARRCAGRAALLDVDGARSGEERRGRLRVSAGNTGALMAMAKICLRTMARIERPAIAAIWPTMRGRIDRARCRRDDRRRRAASCRSRGHGRGDGAYRLRHRAPDGRPAECRRRGDQGARGGEGGRRASCARPIPPRFRYQGFVEGDDIGKGTVDVVVTEGFAGNIALKTRRRHGQADWPNTCATR